MSDVFVITCPFVFSEDRLKEIIVQAEKYVSFGSWLNWHDGIIVFPWDSTRISDDDVEHLSWQQLKTGLGIMAVQEPFAVACLANDAIDEGNAEYVDWLIQYSLFMEVLY
jgi:hypothetical protein